MTINILAFGIAKDIINGSTLGLEIQNGTTVGDLKMELIAQFPDFEKLRSLVIAVNEEYQEDGFILSEKDEIVIIPPVSGG
ncbi:MoaD/ThiS family protein [Saprospiraceae bacterium]|nr:MoaD/ThiS family protein [Saprospiraceae bacterium]MDG1435271.1 MoaD/ThiS family protein [Saprospiraceae bacterium]